MLKMKSIPGFFLLQCPIFTLLLLLQAINYSYHWILTLSQVYQTSPLRRAQHSRTEIGVIGVIYVSPPDMICITLNSWIESVLKLYFADQDPLSYKFCAILVKMMSMALMYGGSVSAVNLRPSLCKVNSVLDPIRRIRKQPQKMISNAGFTTPPISLRSNSSSFMNSGLLRLEVNKFTDNIARSSHGGALSSECSVAISTEALRWLFGVAAVWVWVQSCCVVL